MASMKILAFAISAVLVFCHTSAFPQDLLNGHRQHGFLNKIGDGFKKVSTGRGPLMARYLHPSIVKGGPRFDGIQNINDEVNASLGGYLRR